MSTDPFATGPAETFEEVMESTGHPRTIADVAAEATAELNLLATLSRLYGPEKAREMLAQQPPF
jgi:hypothetical protein